MLWVGSLAGKKYNPQGKFHHEYVNKKDPRQLKRNGDIRPRSRLRGNQHLRAEPTPSSLLTASPAPDSLFPSPFHGCFRHPRLSFRK